MDECDRKRAAGGTRGTRTDFAPELHCCRQFIPIFAARVSDRAAIGAFGHGLRADGADGSMLDRWMDSFTAATAGLPLLPVRWNRALFHEMRGYGLQFQFITMAQAAREPVTKALLAKFGGLAFTGFYDMASRWVFTFRELIVQANLVLVPTVANLRERAPRSIPAIYRESYRVIFFLSVPAFAFLTAVSPIISRIWIGRYEPAFVIFVALLPPGGW